jgi:D-sedoheptulose 7-phosphate isomerase
MRLLRVPVDLEPAAAVGAYFEASATVLRETGTRCSASIAAVAARLTASVLAGGKILLCGNGGSAADAQHGATELVSTLTRGVVRPPIAAIALTTDTSFLTAFANDYGYGGVFARQVEALGRAGDAVLLISTSGNSENLQQAAVVARQRGLVTIGLLGGSGGKLAAQVDLSIIVPSADTQHIQEAHAAVLHVICSLVERGVFPQPTS